MKMDEWLAEVERLRKRQPDGFSTSDLMSEKGWGRDKTQRFIRDGISFGLLVYSGDRITTNAANRTASIPVYKVVKK